MQYVFCFPASVTGLCEFCAVECLNSVGLPLKTVGRWFRLAVKAPEDQLVPGEACFSALKGESRAGF